MIPCDAWPLCSGSRRRRGQDRTPVHRLQGEVHQQGDVWAGPQRDQRRPGDHQERTLGQGRGGQLVLFGYVINISRYLYSIHSTVYTMRWFSLSGYILPNNWFFFPIPKIWCWFLFPFFFFLPIYLSPFLFFPSQDFSFFSFFFSVFRLFPFFPSFFIFSEKLNLFPVFYADFVSL